MLKLQERPFYHNFSHLQVFCRRTNNVNLIRFWWKGLVNFWPNLHILQNRASEGTCCSSSKISKNYFKILVKFLLKFQEKPFYHNFSHLQVFCRRTNNVNLIRFWWKELVNFWPNLHILQNRASEGTCCSSSRILKNYSKIFRFWLLKMFWKPPKIPYNSLPYFSVPCTATRAGDTISAYGVSEMRFKYCPRGGPSAGNTKVWPVINEAKCGSVLSQIWAL